MNTEQKRFKKTMKKRARILSLDRQVKAVKQVHARKVSEQKKKSKAIMEAYKKTLTKE